jgi:para-aminobenzoate synthetase component 1
MRRCHVETSGLAVPPDPVLLATRLARLDGFTGLIGSGGHADARYSILAALPREEVVVPAGAREPGVRPFERLGTLVAETRVDAAPPGPFPGGVIALLGYDLRIDTERLPDRHPPDWGCPDLLARVFDAAIVCDRREGGVELVRLVDPADAAFTRRAAAAAEALADAALSTRAAAEGPIPVSEAGCRLLAHGDYARAVAGALELIRAGDIYQVNLSHRIEGPWDGDATSLLGRVTDRNPSPFGALVRLPGGSWLLSASPERFLRVDGRRVVTRPIKGTIARGATPAEDAALAGALAASRKDRAELAMIVDLLRNDLSRSCAAGTVEVVEPFALESHPTVHHLVATIAGTIVPGRTTVDVVRDAWPGGSISGVPKIRAMEVIDALEHARRGPYTGSLGWFGFDGRADLAILIRTMRLEAGRAWLHGGGGITIRSDPDSEWRESLVKVRGLCDALGWLDRDASLRTAYSRAAR